MSLNPKRKAREARKAKARAERTERKVTRLRERRCWWTRPFGHEYETKPNAVWRGELRCVACGRETFKSPY